MCDRLALDPEAIRIVEGDTDLAMFGGGTFGSRSAALGGSAIAGACDKIIDKGRLIAAHLLEAAEADVTFADGRFTVAGTDKSVSLAEVASAAHTPQRLAPEIEPGLEATSAFCPESQNWPYCCHVCEVEVDPDTGVVDVVRFTSVGDEGTVINPLLLEAQVHGSVAQSLGQALLENVVFDDESGQLLTGSFMDYCMPRADDFCGFTHESEPVPTATNPLGVKGAGEIYSVASLPAVVNAVVDALDEVGVRHIDLPLTPERVWRAIHRSGSMAETAKVD